MQNEPDERCCELCGEPLTNGEPLRQISKRDSEFFSMDTGTRVHKECYLDSKPISMHRADKAAKDAERAIDAEYDNDWPCGPWPPE